MHSIGWGFTEVYKAGGKSRYKFGNSANIHFYESPTILLYGDDYKRLKV